MNDIAGLAAIVATILVVALVVGVDTPLFAVAMFAALGALVFGEQRLRDRRLASHARITAPSPAATSGRSLSPRAQSGRDVRCQPAHTSHR